MAFPPANHTSLLDFSQPAPPPPIVSFQPPPMEALSRYDRSRLPTDQYYNIPQTFRDAMIVRQQVFVQEQRVPMHYEYDEDDPRSAHWVLYSQTAAALIPVGTIRLVPFPHPAHPVSGGVYVDGRLVAVNPVSAYPPPTGNSVPADRSTTYHNYNSNSNGSEPYLKLGRLAIVPSHRGRRLAGVLINAAIDWAVRNSAYFNHEHGPEWKGLVLIHAQKSAVRVWRYAGFIEDEGMGSWWEEGMEHVGMYRRVNVDVEEEVRAAAPPLSAGG
ncbi:hypothetical protein NKR19_g10288 [Coniochaeta hoffmannii]|uniref:N-acetyltransferase domain-containing protein n=1 Tax=Coniochaeta hoffmannii TaxID=91930 RepID=A0AA38VFC2_9PEZI|nr:hypothetical protein NKR19_g10288 [Coniochaeta hoffmannii]